MDMVKSKTQNWVDFMTIWEPVIADKTAFAVWTNAQNQRFAYIVWDTDAQAIIGGSYTTAFVYILKDTVNTSVTLVIVHRFLLAFICLSTEVHITNIVSNYSETYLLPQANILSASHNCQCIEMKQSGKREGIINLA